MSRQAAEGSRDNMRHGLISLLTVVVVISLATAAVLAVSTSHAMHALANRQANMNSQGYDTERSAQAFLAELDALLHEQGSTSRTMSALNKQANRMLASVCEEGVTATYELNGNDITCTFTSEGGRMLQTVVRLENTSYIIESWHLSAAPQEEDTGDTLWTGTTTEN